MDLYHVLEINENASPEEIKMAFRRKVKQYHPDVCKSKNAEKKIKQVILAYETLQKNNLHTDQVKYQEKSRNRNTGRTRCKPRWWYHEHEVFVTYKPGKRNGVPHWTEYRHPETGQIFHFYIMETIRPKTPEEIAAEIEIKHDIKQKAEERKRVKREKETKSATESSKKIKANRERKRRQNDAFYRLWAEFRDWLTGKSFK